MGVTGQRIQASLLDTARKLAMEKREGVCPSLPEVSEELAGSLRREDLRFIKDGKEGLDMSGSVLDDPEYIELCVRCRLVPLTNSFNDLGADYERRCLAHIWVGYENGFFPDEEYVYITDDSEIYHRDRECSHIRLTVIETDANELGSRRNSSGARYRPCGICHSRPGDGKLYITPEGDRYHNSITCSGLKRTVRAVKLSEVGDRRPCSRCGR